MCITLMSDVRLQVKYTAVHFILSMSAFISILLNGIMRFLNASVAHLNVN